MNLGKVSFNREKKVTISFDGVTQEFILVAPSVKDKETALQEAQRIQADTVKLLPGMAESLRAVYLLQEVAVLAEAALEAEHGQLLHKATLTLVEQEPGYAEKLAAKVQVLKEARKPELAALTKEQLVDKLVGAELNKQLSIAREAAQFDAALVQALRSNDGQRLFGSVEDMKTALPTEVLIKLYEAITELLFARGDAKVFPEPHISKG